MSVINIGGKAAIKLIFPKDYIASCMLPLSGDYATINSVVRCLLRGMNIGLSDTKMKGVMEVVKASGFEGYKYSSTAIMFVMGYLQAKADMGSYISCTISSEYMDGFIALTDPKFQVEPKHEPPTLRLVQAE